jgi:hypothetical protein
MVRPRWHDALIVSAITGLLLVGIWALWWDDVRRLWDSEPASGSAAETTPAANPQT